MQLFFFKNMEMYMEWFGEDHTQEALRLEATEEEYITKTHLLVLTP